jgi:hypothetical protein
MRKLLVALVALTAAAALVLIGLPALAAGPRSFTAHSKTVRAGQRIKVSGKGCGSQAFVRFYLNDIEIDDDRADRAGQFVDNVEIPTSMDLGEAEVKAGCSGYRVGTATITVLGSRFDVEPRRVEAGELVTVSGSLCKPRSYVTVKLNGRLIGDGRATGRGQFRIRVRIPSDAEDSVQVSARCHGKFVGVKIIIIVIIYPTQQSLGQRRPHGRARRSDGHPPRDRLPHRQPHGVAGRQAAQPERWRRGPEHLRRGGLVEAGLDSGGADGLQQPDGAEPGRLSRVLRDLEGHLDVALGAQVVDLVRGDGPDQVDQRHRVGQVAVVELQTGPGLMRVLVHVVEPAGVE